MLLQKWHSRGNPYDHRAADAECVTQSLTTVEAHGGGVVQEPLPSKQSHHLDNRRHSLRVSTASVTHPGPAESNGVTLGAETHKVILK